MKLLMENWRKFLIKENFILLKKKKMVMLFIDCRKDISRLRKRVIMQEGAHSVYGFYVDEEHRRKGIGKQLVKIVIDAYPNEEISAQVSSHASLKVFLELGFRVTQKPDADYEKAKKLLMKIMEV